MDAVNNDLSVRMSNIDLGGVGSLQMLYATLQLAQSGQAKDDAMAYIEKIQNNQAKQEECAEMIRRAQALQNTAGEDGATDMPADMVKFYNDNGIDYDKTATGRRYHNKDEWDFNIQQLTGLRDQLGTSTQQDMVFVNDFMGQYNSLIQGANSTIQQANQTLQALAAAR